MILAGYDNTKITIFDCNTDGKCGVKYYKQTYQTFASKNSGMSLYHSTKYPAMKLSKPKITKCEAKSETSIKVEWGKVDNAVKYKLVRTEKDKKNKKTVYEGTGTSHTDTGLKAGTAYYYTAYAENGGKSSDASDTYKMYTKLAAPKIEVKADGASQITVTWDKVQGAKSYTVLGRKTGEKTYATLKSGLTGTSYTDTDHKIKGVKKPLEPGTKYYYRVKAVGVGTVGPAGKLATRTVESDESETKSKFTNMKRPENGTEAGKGNLVTLEWEKVKGSGDMTYTYDVYRDKKRIAKGIKGKSHRDEKATAGRVHTYEVKMKETAKDGKVMGGNYRCSSGPFHAGPRINELVVEPKSASKMKISWRKPSGLPKGATYAVKKRAAGGDWAKEPIKKGLTTTSCADTNVSKGKEYEYYVQTLDKDGNVLTRTMAKAAKLDIPPAKVKLSKSKVELAAGETMTLSATVSPNNSFDKTVSWSSSDQAVATVAAGKVTAKAAGKATVTAKTSNGKSASCAVTVRAKECAHDYGNWAVDKKATCEEAGTRHRECGKCGAVEAELIEALGHAYSQEWKVTAEATCAAEGERARVCEKCRAKTDREVLETTEHEFEETWVTEEKPTCGQEGRKTRKCRICGETEEVIETVEHAYALTAETEPTLDGPGTRTYVCGACGDSFTEEWTRVVSEGAVSVGGSSAKAGGTVTIPVAISGNPGISGFTFQVDYDESALTPKKITAGDLLKGADGNVKGTFVSNLDQGAPASELERVTAHWQNDADAKGDGVLFNVEFDVAEGTGEGSYAVGLSYEDGDVTNQTLDDVKPDVLGNAVTIADVLRGDVNLDRTVDLRDGVLLARYLAKWNVSFTDAQKKAADVYKDGKINVKDGVRLLQLLVGYEGPEGESRAARARTKAAPKGADGPKVAVEGAGCAAGGTVSVPVTIEGNGGVSGFDMRLEYDSERLTPVSVEKGDMLVDGEFSSSLEEGSGAAPGAVAAHWGSPIDVTEDGELFAVEFKVKEGAETGQTGEVRIVEGESAICDQDLNDVGATLEGGEVAVSEPEKEEEAETADLPPYEVNDVTLRSKDGQELEEIPAKGGFDVAVSVVGTTEGFRPSRVVVAAYGANGRLLEVATEAVPEERSAGWACGLRVGETREEIAKVKAFLWDADRGMAPTAYSVTISKDRSDNSDQI